MWWIEGTNRVYGSTKRCLKSVGMGSRGRSSRGGRSGDRSSRSRIAGDGIELQFKIIILLSRSTILIINDLLNNLLPLILVVIVILCHLST
jgi:hypothetical protein